MTRKLNHLPIPALLLLWFTTACMAAEPTASQRIYSLPMFEAVTVVRPWLRHNAFQLTGSVQNEQGVKLEVLRNGACWTIQLSPHSPLATRIAVTPDDPADATLDPLWQHLEAYTTLPRPTAKTFAGKAPETVWTALAAAVCIHAEQERAPVQLSGFAIDRKGIILSTGHDLQMDQAVTVRLSNGTETAGRVVALDRHRDLTLIQVPVPLQTVISLHNGRFMPAPQAPLFVLGCPAGEFDGIRHGRLDGPPRQVAGLPLWQARMVVEPGSSGSPVLDGEGRLVAVVKGRYRGSHDIGFLIPLETLLYFLENH